MLADFSFLSFFCRSTNDSINHLPISQLPNSKYILSGETTAHISIDDLVEHYSHVRHDLQNREYTLLEEPTARFIVSSCRFPMP